MAFVVTGAAGILGQAVCDCLKQEGKPVLGVDLVEEAPAGLGAEEYVGGVNLTDPTATDKLVETVKERGLKVDALINIAGTFVWETVADGGLDTWQRMFDINLSTTHNMCKSFMSDLKGGSSIVNIGAAAAANADMGMGAYAASKSAVLRLTETLSVELKEKGVRVNAVSPLIIDTPQNRADMPDSDFTQWVTPAEIANTISFLTSPLASGITGQNICLTGRM